MDSESRAAAGLLAALGRAAASFAELRHPFVRREPISRFDPGGATCGVLFVLPDGREVRFAVSIAFSANSFHVNGEAMVEERHLVELPTVSTSSVREVVLVLDRYVGEVVSPARWLLEQLMEELTEL